MLDDHGQPPSAFNYTRNLTKATESLLGLCRGLLADRELNDAEITYLDTWLRENAIVADAWPGNVIVARVRQVLADHIITAEERNDLQETLAALTGMDLSEGITAGLATRTAAEPPATVDFEGRTYCLTGRFLYGPRRRCEAAVRERGATLEPRVTRRLDYLVIGALASRDWANTSHGRKIEQAIQYRDRGIAAISILDEEAWTAAL